MASIHPRGPKKDGTYSYRLMWRDPEYGPKHATFQEKAEAELWQRLLDANGQSLTVADKAYENSRLDGPTVHEAITQHIEQLVDVTPYTIKRYRGALRNHFNGPLGSLKVKGLKNADIVAWIKWMQSRGKSPKTISDKHGLLSAALLTQVRAGTIDRNPCDGVRLPKKRRVGDDGDDINMDDYKAIRSRMDAHFHPFVDFLVGTGCRFSEATVLTGNDFNLEGDPPLVFITKAHKLGGEDNPARYVGEPKSQKSRRRVSMAPSTVEKIAPLVEQSLKDGGPVFRMKQGGTVTHQSFYNRCWRDARKEAGLGPDSGRKITVHSLRHLHASALLAAGMDMFQLSTRLGHENINITIGTYSHMLPDAHFKGAQFAARALEEVPVLEELVNEID